MAQPDHKIKPDKVAVFYDFCNFCNITNRGIDLASSLVMEIFDEAKRFGEIVESFAFTSTSTHPQEETMLKLKGFHVVVCPPVKPPKDTADETLKHFVRIMLEHAIDTFIIVSGDGDFAALKPVVENTGRRFVVFHNGTINNVFALIGCETVDLRQKKNSKPQQQSAKDEIAQPPNNNNGPVSRNDGPKHHQGGKPATPVLNRIRFPPKQPLLQPPPQSSNGHSESQDETLVEETGRPTRVNTIVETLPRPSPLDANKYYEILQNLIYGTKTDTQTIQWNFLREIIRVLSHKDLASNEPQKRKSFLALVNTLRNEEDIQKSQYNLSLQDFVDVLSALTREKIRILETRTYKNSSQKYYVFRAQNDLLKYFLPSGQNTSPHYR